jgi:hypothetical protein
LVEKHGIGLFISPSSVKVGLSQIGGDKLTMDNTGGGIVLELYQDPYDGSISNITQENYIFSLLANNYKTGAAVYELLSKLANENLIDLDGLINTHADGKASFFKQKLVNILAGIGDNTNTLLLAQEDMNSNIGVLKNSLSGAISKAVREAVAKHKMEGFRATVFTGTGLVNMYEVTRPDLTTARMNKKQLISEGAATIDSNGEIIPNDNFDIIEDELAFMSIVKKSTGKHLDGKELESYITSLISYDTNPESKKYVDSVKDDLIMNPMEVMLPNHFKNKFGIPEGMDVHEVTREVIRAGVAKEYNLQGAEKVYASAKNDTIDIEADERWKVWQSTLYPKLTRIPVTGPNSTQMGKVVGFYSSQSNTVLVPYELHIIAGSDIDGDMLTIEYPFVGENFKLNPIESIKNEMFEAKKRFILDPMNTRSTFAIIDFEELLQRSKKNQSTKRNEFYSFASNVGALTDSQDGAALIGRFIKLAEVYYTTSSIIGMNQSQSESDYYESLGVTYTDENNKPCSPGGLPLAESGMQIAKFKKGGKWELVNEFKGASHKQGGIDIEISGGTVKSSRNGGNFEAANGLIVAAGGMVVNTDPKEGENAVVDENEKEMTGSYKVAQRLIETVDAYKGYTPDQLLNVIDTIGQVESGGKNIRQFIDSDFKNKRTEGTGPASGFYQIEDNSLVVAKQRLANSNTDFGLGLDLTRFNDVTQAMDLNQDDQRIMAMLNLHKAARVKGAYINPDDIRSTWLDYHWAGADDQREARGNHFDEVIKSLIGS